MKRYLQFFLVTSLFFNNLIYAQNQSQNALTILNDFTLNFYQRAKNLQAEKLKPYIIVNGDTITLVTTCGQNIKKNIIPESYTQLKTFAQLSLGIFSLSTLPSNQKVLLERYRVAILKAKKTIPSLSLSPDLIKNQYALVNESLKFIHKTQILGKVSRQNLAAYFSTINPLLEKNVNAAAIAEVNRLDQIMQQFRQKLSPNEWQHLQIVVLGPHMPRKENLLLQYFSRRLKKPIDSQHLIYGEALTTNEQAKELLARFTLDTTLGKVVFQDAKRMHRDLLGDATRKYLESQT